MKEKITIYVQTMLEALPSEAWKILITVLVSSLCLELFIPPSSHFSLDGILFFNSLFGCLSCLAIVIISKLVGVFVKRSERYYEHIKKDLA